MWERTDVRTRQSIHLSICSSVDRIVSALYLLQYSPDPFHIYTSYQATSEGVSCVKFYQNEKIWSFGKFFKFVNLSLSCFHLGSNMNRSIVWVIMGSWGVSSERKRSSFCSFPWKIACLSDCKMGLFWTLMHCPWLNPNAYSTSFCFHST